MMTEQAVIVTKNLSKWYGDVRGILGVSLEIPKGITGLVGSNAAGKTTLLHLISGLLKPSQGEVQVLGESAFDGTHFRRQLGLCPQKEALYQHTTVLEFVSILTELHGFSPKEAKKKAQEAIEKVRLSHKIHQKIETLSKGMRQCVKLAQAIAHKPGILLLDEVLTGCDPLVKHHLKALFHEMAQEGATILITSHNLKELEELTDKIVVLDRGKMIAHGKISELQKQSKKQKNQISIEGENLRSLACDLLSYNDITGIEIQEKGILVHTQDFEAFSLRLPGLFSEKDYKIKKIMPVTQNLESLFRFLVGGEH
ncbi:MAG: ABC transporter ATP-binding protein [Candidatus Brocadiae bacterium]|nr:ABC transporter ATP-binding protein [Candidatus Brocadiia bacterium]